MTPLQTHYKAARKLDDEAIAALVTAIMQTLPTGLHNRRGIQKLVRVYFGQQITDVSIRTDFRCKQAGVEVYRAAVREFLCEIRASLKQVA
jgi:hypothetical protein